MSASAALVVGAFVVMVACNALAQQKFFGGKDNKELSDEHPTYVSPDGPTFAIWGLIYLLEIVLVVTQAFPSTKTDVILGQVCPLTGLDVRQRITLAFLANSVWLPVFNNERFWSALAIMLVYLGLLVSIYSDLNVETVGNLIQSVTLAGGIAMNLSWILVATAVSVLFVGAEAGWKDRFGVAGSVPVAVVTVLLVAAIGCERVLRAGDYYWAFVAAWALRGIYRMQTIPDAVRFPLDAMNANLAQTARFASFAVLIAMAGRAAMTFI